MNEIKFSIVVPTFNRENLIAKTLESIKNQTHLNWEVFVVDNRSTDGTAEAVAPFLEDQRFNFIVNEKNMERGFSRNVGMNNATGDFLTFLDSDDLMLPNCLSDAADFASNNNHKIFHNYYVLKNSQGDTLYNYTYPDTKKSVAEIAKGNFLSCIGVFIAPEIYKKFRFDVESNITGTEDWDFWLHIIPNFELGRIPKVNSIIVDHSERTVHQKGLADDILEKKKRIISKIKNSPELEKVYSPYLAEMNACAYLYSGTLAAGNSEGGKARGFLIEAIKLKPQYLLTKRAASILVRSIIN